MASHIRGFDSSQINQSIVPFVEEITSNCQVIGIVGYFCNTIAQHLSQIARTWITYIVQISATSQKVDRPSVSLLQHSILPLRGSIASNTVQLNAEFRVEQDCSHKQPILIFCEFQTCLPQDCKRMWYSNRNTYRGI